MKGVRGTILWELRKGNKAHRVWASFLEEWSLSLVCKWNLNQAAKVRESILSKGKLSEQRQAKKCIVERAGS